MKIVAKPIKTMVVFEYEGKTPIPYKFKLQRDDGSEQLIKIDKRIDSYRQKRAGIETVICNINLIPDLKISRLPAWTSCTLCKNSSWS